MSIWDAFGKGRYKGFSREAGQLLEKAVERYLPELTPDFLRVRRRAILDAEGRDFR